MEWGEINNVTSYVEILYSLVKAILKSHEMLIFSIDFIWMANTSWLPINVRLLT